MKGPLLVARTAINNFHCNFSNAIYVRKVNI